eukprot:11191548-Lingulodinium_polyedra.AAC.1
MRRRFPEDLGHSQHPYVLEACDSSRNCRAAFTALGSCGSVPEHCFGDITQRVPSDARAVGFARLAVQGV